MRRGGGAAARPAAYASRNEAPKGREVREA